MSAATVDTPGELLSRLLELRPFPDVAQKLLEACQRDGTHAGDLADIIQYDAVVSLRLLKTANSSIYGFPGEIGSIQHAVVVLGFRAVRDLAVSMAAADVFTGDSGATEDHRRLWLHSLGCGTVARSLSMRVAGVTAEEAFLAGMVHDVGKLAFLDAYSDEYPRMTGSVGSADIIDVESRTWDTTHTEVGTRCAESWGLPGGIAEAICHHHTPHQAIGHCELVAVVAAANRLTHAWNVGGQANPDVDDNAGEVLKSVWPDASDEDIEDLRARIPEEFSAVQEAWA